MCKHTKLQERLFVTVFLLFFLQVILLPVCVGVTYASRGEKPEHILTYEDHSLVWDADTAVDAQGSAKLSLFQSEYQGIRSEDGVHLVAPGEETERILRLCNEEKSSIGYTAVLYTKKEEILPVEVSLTGSGFADTDVYQLPDGVEPTEVIRAVSGELAGGQMQEFDISWSWAFEDEADLEGQDQIDTSLGDGAAAGDAQEIQLGVYVVVTEDSKVVTPDSPKTGDVSALGWYLLLLAASGITLLLLVIERRKQHE